MIKAYKPVGLTPLELLQLIKQQYPEYNNQKIAYAGRLDPMAEGLIIYLNTELEKQNRKDFENLSKTYEFDLLLGLQTDSYDILGIPRMSSLLGKPTIQSGKQVQKYPPYSYYRIQGKPLFWWARHNKLCEIEIPQKEITILSYEKLKEYSLDNKQLFQYIEERIQKVKGDFRQKEILEAWKSLLKTDGKFKCLKAKIVCSGGTYIRGLVNDLGGVALNINRTNIGDFDLLDVLSLNYESKV